MKICHVSLPSQNVLRRGGSGGGHNRIAAAGLSLTVSRHGSSDRISIVLSRIAKGGKVFFFFQTRTSNGETLLGRNRAVW